MRQRFNINRLNPGPKNEQGKDWTENVYAYIEGNDPTLKNEIVVAGSHLDHIGYGRSMARDSVIGVHNGADDNDSGSVSVLSMAKAFSLLGPLPRTVVFQWYSAEEMGLIGSRYYTNNPLFPLNSPNINKHVFMLNQDMVGRLGTGQYAVGWATGNSSIDIKKIVNELNQKYTFAKNITSYGSGGSDHASFYNKHVPIAFLHTGLHSDYHTIKDDADKINYKGLERISRYATELLYKVTTSDSRPKFNYKEFKPMEYTHDHGHGGDVRFIHPWHLHEHKH